MPTSNFVFDVADLVVRLECAKCQTAVTFRPASAADVKHCPGCGEAWRQAPHKQGPLTAVEYVVESLRQLANDDDRDELIKLRFEVDREDVQ